ncbi:MAG: cysteine synthase A [Coriobacteriaceae bacterium]|nr:cysteine synthase A [Coriobacteriaceae bacterium]MDY5371422.1 cysteine synthase A [Eggerthellaceae bacterium]
MPQPAVLNENVAQSIIELIGNTPLLQLNRFAANNDLKGRVLAKLEYRNPAGSVKDRIGYSLIAQAEHDGILKPGGTIIEPTSGNTGIALAAYGAALGYKVVIVLPESLSVERRALIRQYGAELVLTPAADGIKGSIAKAQEIHAATPNSFIPQQFENPANPAIHAATTAEEIWRDTAGAVDIVIGGVGTGGTISGIGQALKPRKEGLQIIAVQPEESPILDGGKPGPHGIQGIIPGFVAKNYDAEIVDEVISVSTAQSITTSQELARTEGVNNGISSGAALAAAAIVAARPENEGKTIVVILPDTGERYLSTALFPKVDE